MSKYINQQLDSIIHADDRASELIHSKAVYVVKIISSSDSNLSSIVSIRSIFNAFEVRDTNPKLIRTKDDEIVLFEIDSKANKMIG